ncbi:MAG: extensin family protein [Blastocatellia bacterium]
MYIRTGERSTQWPLQYGLGDAAACAPDASTNGALCSINSKNGGSTTAVFVPDTARGANPVCLLVWIHGDLVCGGEGKNAISYVKGKTFPLAQQLADSNRPFVLVVPRLWEYKGGDSHILGSPQKMNAFLEEVRAGLTGAGWSSPPSIGRLILAGHSRGHTVLNGLAARVSDAQSWQGALATLTDVWLFDTTYGERRKEWLSDIWKRWAALKSGANLRVLYIKNSQTAAVAELIRDKAATSGLKNVAVNDVDLKPLPKAQWHCAMPRKLMPNLLAAVGNCPARSNGPHTPRPAPSIAPAPATQPSNGSLFQRIQNALASGQWYVALGLASLSGDRDVNRLTNMIFFARRPELKGRKLAPTEPNFKQLSREWIEIRDTIIRPFLAKTAPAKPPASSGSEAKPSPAPSTTPGTIPPWLKGRISPRGGGTTIERCEDRKPQACPLIPDFLRVTGVNDVPFEYVASDTDARSGKRTRRIVRNPATGLYEVVNPKVNLEQGFIPEVGTALYTFIVNMAKFGMPVAAILTMGSYNCRCMSGTSELSNHSFGDAIDITGVRWPKSGGPASTLPATIIHNFNSGDQREMILVRRINACLRLSFARVIDYHNKGLPHCDHFHCDLRNTRRRDRLPKASSTLSFAQEALTLVGHEVPITGKWDPATRRGLTDFSGVSSAQSLERDDKLLNQIMDNLFLRVASGKIATQPRVIALSQKCKSQL